MHARRRINPTSHHAYSNEMGKEHTESEVAFNVYDRFGILSLHMPEGKFYLLERIRRLFKN